MHSCAVGQSHLLTTLPFSEYSQIFHQHISHLPSRLNIVSAFLSSKLLTAPKTDAFPIVIDALGIPTAEILLHYTITNQTLASANNSWRERSAL
jgi:hypothetical protein